MLLMSSVTGKHQCLDLAGGEDATTGSSVVLNSCKGEEDDNQEWEYLEDYNTFRIPLDVADDTSRFGDLCMGTKRSFNEKLKPDTYEVVAVNCEDSWTNRLALRFTPPVREVLEAFWQAALASERLQRRLANPGLPADVAAWGHVSMARHVIFLEY